MRIAFILFIAIFFISCKEEIKKPVDTVKITTKNENSSINTVTKSDTSKSKEEVAKINEPRIKISSEMNLSKQQLLEFLPKDISGFELVAPTSGTIRENDSTVNVFVKGQYKGKGSSATIIIDINDFGINSASEMFYQFKKIPKDPGYKYELLSETGGNGYLRWQEELKSGVIRYSINDRFTIIIRAEKSTFELLKSYFKLLNVSKLKNY